MARQVKISTLRRKALQQLNQRLDEGMLSAADLLRVVLMEAEAELPTTRGDWVLQLSSEGKQVAEEAGIE